MPVAYVSCITIRGGFRRGGGGGGGGVFGV